MRRLYPSPCLLPGRSLVAYFAPKAGAMTSVSLCSSSAHPLHKTLRGQVNIDLLSRYFTSTSVSSNFYARYTEEELSLVRQAHMEGRSYSDIVDLVTSADRPKPDMHHLFQRALGQRTYPREHITPRDLPRRRAWTSAEDDILRQSYAARRTARSVCEELGRSLASVQRRLSRIIIDRIHRGPKQCGGGERKSKSRTWTTEEDRQLVEMWRQGLADGSIAERLSSGRSSISVQRRRQLLGLFGYKTRGATAVWTAANEEELRRICADETLDNEEIGKRLSPPRSADAVDRRKVTLGLGRPAARPWDASEEKELHELAKRGLSVSEITEMLSTERTYGGIITKLQALGLRQPTEREYRHKPQSWLDEDISKLRSLRDSGVSCKAIAKVMGRGESAIRNKLRRLQLELQEKGEIQLEHLEQENSTRTSPSAVNV